MLLPLVTSKVTMPGLPRLHLQRAALVGLIDDGLSTSTKLLLVSAPAGYGKTTLVVEWARSSDQKIAWFNIDGNDNDPARFIRYLGYSLNKACGLSSDFTEISTVPNISDAVISILVNLIEDNGIDIIVLDDFHYIRDPAIHHIVKSLITHLRPEHHIVITTREDPPLPLARLRSRQQICEIRARELRFNMIETGAFLRSSGVSIDQNSVEIINNRTEGWAAGVQLASLSMRDMDKENINLFISDFGGSYRHVIDYLFEEVYEKQPSDIKNFLCKTSILERLCGSLCRHVTGVHNAEALLERLEATNTFLTAMDGFRKWYRYHRLFKDVLMSFIDPSQASDLHSRAGHWFKAEGYPVEACHHYIEARNWDALAGIIPDVFMQLLGTGELSTLYRILQCVPEEIAKATPEILTYLGWSLFLTGRVHEAMMCTAALNDSTASITTQSSAWLNALRLWFKNISGMRNPAEVLAIADGILRGLDEADNLLKAIIMLPMGHSSLRTGDLKGSVGIFKEARRLALDTHQYMIAMTALANEVFTLDDLGLRLEAIRACEDAVSQLSDANKILLPITDIILIPMGCLFYGSNDLIKAKELISRGLGFCKRYFSDFIMGGDGEICLANIYAALDDWDKGVSILKGFKDASSSKIVGIDKLVDAHIASFAARRGRLDEVKKWLVSNNGSRDGSPYKRAISLIYSRCLIYCGKYSHALQNLNQCEYHPKAELEAMILRSLALRGLNRYQEAAVILSEAVKQASRQNYIRLFVDAGSAITDLLIDLKTTGEEKSFVDSILTNFTVPSPQMPNVALSGEYLSAREMEILALVSKGLSNREIAQSLFITEGTAKWHTHNVLSKVGAHRRTELVSKARELGLLK